MKIALIITNIILVSLNFSSQAQSIQKQVLSNSGKKMNAGGVTLNYTLGEMSVSRHNNAAASIAQGFQPYYLTINTPLPVSWKSFEARRINEQQADLLWVLSSEKNCKGFHIEKMKEGEKEFTTIAFIDTKAENGMSDLETKYTFNDNRFNNTRTLYRIRQEDMDGKITYSETRLVLGSGRNDVKMEIWPIPAYSSINILLNDLGKNSNVLILDMNGKVVKRLPIQNQNKVEVNGLASGIYIVQLEDNKSISQKIIVQ